MYSYVSADTLQQDQVGVSVTTANVVSTEVRTNVADLQSGRMNDRQKGKSANFGVGLHFVLCFNKASAIAKAFVCHSLQLCTGKNDAM